LIGLQDLLIKKNTSVTKLAKDLGMPPGRIWEWFQVNRIPDKYLKTLAEIFDMEEEYFGKQVNDINTHRPRKRGFNDYEIRGDITVIFMPKRDGRMFETIIDTKNLERIKNLGLGWSAAWIKSVDKYYAKASEYIGNGQPNITHYLHIEIMESKEFVVDHRDRDRLNNREVNLRVTKQLLNTKNRTSKNKNNKSGHRNVYWNTKDEMWVVSLQIDGKSREFGRFKFNDLGKAGERAEAMRQLHYKEFAGEIRLFKSNKFVI